MGIHTKASQLTVEQYLKYEETASTRHEYVDGRIFAMSGATRRHNCIAGNLHALIHARLKGSPCSVYISDVKVHVAATNSFYYPDLMVACDKHDRKSVYTASPVLIVEVLSRSTAAIDRREKMCAYRQIPELREYLIVSQNRRAVELQRRSANGGWEIFEFELNSIFALDSLPGEPLLVVMDDIYDGIDVDSRGGFVREKDEPVIEEYAEPEVEWLRW